MAPNDSLVDRARTRMFHIGLGRPASRTLNGTKDCGDRVHGVATVLTPNIGLAIFGGFFPNGYVVGRPR